MGIMSCEKERGERGQNGFRRVGEKRRGRDGERENANVRGKSWPKRRKTKQGQVWSGTFDPRTWGLHLKGARGKGEEEISLHPWTRGERKKGWKKNEPPQTRERRVLAAIAEAARTGKESTM